jgi:L-fucose isomerase-like protein
MESLKAGYVSFNTSYVVDDSIHKKLREMSESAIKQLEDAGIEIVQTDPVWGFGERVERAVKELKAEDWDFLIVNILQWIDYRGVMKVLLEFRDKPLILYSYGAFYEGDRLVTPAPGAGSTAIRYPLERWGFKFKYLFNAPGAPMDVENILKFGRAAQIKRKLSRSKVGMIGFHDMGLYTTGFNVTTLRGKIGVELQSIDLLELKNNMDAVDEKQIKENIEKYTKNWEYPLGKPSDAAFDYAMRMFQATIDLIEERELSGFSYKVVEGISRENEHVHSIPSSLIASEGYPYIDENDIGNLIAEMILKWISGKPVTFLEHYEHHPEWILMGVDGFVPNQFIAGNPRIVPRPPIGIAHASYMKTGPMTLTSLAEDDEGYRMHIVTGDAKKAPNWVEFGCAEIDWPAVEFYPHAAVKNILNNVLSQHFAAVFGYYVDELLDFCYLMDIKPVLDIN